MPRNVHADELKRYGTAVLGTLGVPGRDAALLADSLVVAELWGHPSHGMLRLPWYAERLRSGAMAAETKSEAVADNGATLVLDGGAGIGQVLCREMVEIGCERSKRHGVSAVAMRNSNHFGMAAYFTREAAERGCVTLLATNASPAMPPWGGREKFLGTNPWSIAAPAGKHGVAVLDISNTAVARGKIYAAAESGREIPSNWALDEQGEPTTDASKALDGLILPMAEHKGYAIAFMIDVLSGVLTGSRFGRDVAGPYEPERISGAGHLLISIDIAAMIPMEEFEGRMETLIRDIKSVPKAGGVGEIFFPGEVERACEGEFLAKGVPIADRTWASLGKLGAETGVDMPAGKSTTDMEREK